MTQPDFERAQQYALERLQRDLSSTMTYHSVVHTRDEVVPAAEQLAMQEGVDAESLVLLLTAAFYHDLGLVERYVDHEEASARIAGEVLPGFGYSEEQVRIIHDLIMVTKLPHSPHTLLEEIMADADLDILGQDNCIARNQDLRVEMAACGMAMSDEEWYSSQLEFIRAHRYFTATARILRDAKKQENIARMAALLEECRLRDRAVEAPLPVAVDRVAILRSVSIFSETPDDILAEVAALLRPLAFRAWEMIFQKGESGHSMYIIVEGRVRVHDGDFTLNHLGPADVFGEMALLDAEPRVASVTAVEDTHLLRLDQTSFYDLMATRPEVARGVIRVLNRHLRSRVRDMAQDFEYMQQMARITAAATALEGGRYDSRSLDEVVQRPDELGQLARVFQRMANEVAAREQRLRQEVEKLRIQIDEAKKAREVAEITESDYFQQLQQRARELRKE